MKKVYIAGPMTGYEQNNYPAFFEAAELLKQTGLEPINPAANPKCDSWQDYMKHSLKQVVDADMVVTLDGWESSRGASLEVFIATQLGIPVTPLVVQR